MKKDEIYQKAEFVERICLSNELAIFVVGIPDRMGVKLYYKVHNRYIFGQMNWDFVFDYNEENNLIIDDIAKTGWQFYTLFNELKRIEKSFYGEENE